VSKSPEEQLEDFLASKPDWMRRYLQTGIESMTQGDFSEESKWDKNHDDVFKLAVTRDYERILQQIPARWKAYRKRQKRENQWFVNEFLVTKGNAGRPRKDALAQEAVELHQRGMNFPQVAAELNKRHGKETTTPTAVSKLIKRFLARTKSSA